MDRMKSDITKLLSSTANSLHSDLISKKSEEDKVWVVKVYSGFAVAFCCKMFELMSKEAREHALEALKIFVKELNDSEKD